MKSRKLLAKRMTALFLTAVMGASIAGCGAKNTGGGAETTGKTTAPQTTEAATVPQTEGGDTEKSSETLTVVVQAEPTAMSTLNGVSTEAQLVIMDAMGSTLLDYDPVSNGTRPGIASGYEKIDDTHYRFTLREDACYADGTPVTAEDVLYSLTAYSEAGIQNATYFNPEEMKAEDEHTFVFALKEYVPGWEYLVADSATVIYSKAAVEAVGGIENADRTPPVGCGKYNFKEWKSGEYIVLERNDNYWDKDYIGYYQYIKFLFIGDSASRILAVKSGDADVAYRIGTSEYVTLQNDPAATAVALPANGCENLYFNTSKGVFADEKVREAVAHAIDAEAVNAVINMGQGKVVQGLFPEVHPYYREYYEGGHPAYDVEKAKQLLAEAGYPDGLTIECLTMASFKEVCTILQESLRAAGITMNVSVVEQSVYVQETRAGNYDCQVGLTTAGTLNPNNFSQIDPAMVGVSIQSCRITDPAMSEIIAKAQSPDEALAKEGWDELYDYVFGKYCVVGLCSSDKYHAVANGLTGLTNGNRMAYIDVTEMHPEK